MNSNTGTQDAPSRTLLFFGGNSDERLVSVASSQNLSTQYEFSELWFLHFDGSISLVEKEELKAHARPFEIAFVPKAKPFVASLKDALPQIQDATVFLGFHGSEGEDGQIQELLEKAQVKFTGSGSKASALCFDKARAKEIVSQNGGSVAKQILVDVKKMDAAVADLKKFYNDYGRIVIKPVASGSSFGLFIVLNENDFQKAIASIGSLPYGRFLAESFIEGRELTIGVWDRNKKPYELPPSEVIMNSGRNFDYEGKYLGQGSTEITPAKLSEADTKKAQQLAVLAHRALGCYGYSRTDMILTGTGPIFLETNTLPGMTRASFFPQQLAAGGLTMGEFIQSQLQLASFR